MTREQENEACEINIDQFLLISIILSLYTFMEDAIKKTYRYVVVFMNI